MTEILISEPLFLDFSATTPTDARVVDLMSDWFLRPSNAGSRTHLYGKQAKEGVETARVHVSSAAHVKPEDVFFTSGATESNNLALLGLADYGKSANRMHIISTRIEHKAVLEPLAHLEKQGFEIDLVPVSKSGVVDAGEVLDRVRPDTLLVSVMHANNETGMIQPVVEVGQALRDSDVFFHVDAAQTFGKLIDEFSGLSADLISFSSHKVYGPQGIGALVIKKRNGRRIPVTPLQFGGGQERGLRPGTLPVPLIVGFGEAARIAFSESTTRRQSCKAIRAELMRSLEKLDYHLNGSANDGLSNVLNVRFPGVDAEALMMHLRSELAVSNGSACTSDTYTPSHVLTAMGLDEDSAFECIRFSWGPETKVDHFAEIISRIHELVF